MVTYFDNKKLRHQDSTQFWLGVIAFLFSYSIQAVEYTYTTVEGEEIVEFGDFGKAANQYPLSVGDLNIVAPVMPFVANGKIYYGVNPNSFDKNSGFKND